jgi:hypothetical protein
MGAMEIDAVSHHSTWYPRRSMDPTTLEHESAVQSSAGTSRVRDGGVPAVGFVRMHWGIQAVRMS